MLRGEQQGADQEGNQPDQGLRRLPGDSGLMMEPGGRLLLGEGQKVHACSFKMDYWEQCSFILCIKFMNCLHCFEVKETKAKVFIYESNPCLLGTCFVLES